MNTLFPNWNMYLFVFEDSKQLFFKFMQDCCNVTCHFFGFISNLKQVFARKETSYFKISNL